VKRKKKCLLGKKTRRQVDVPQRAPTPIRRTAAAERKKEEARFHCNKNKGINTFTCNHKGGSGNIRCEGEDYNGSAAKTPGEKKGRSNPG